MLFRSDIMDRLEAALPDGFEKTQLLEVVPKHYTAPNKDDIIFYQCRTILFLDDITEDYYKENVYPQIVDTGNCLGVSGPGPVRRGLLGDFTALNCGMPPQAAPKQSPAERVCFGEEEQRNEADIRRKPDGAEWSL